MNSYLPFVHIALLQYQVMTDETRVLVARHLLLQHALTLLFSQVSDVARLRGLLLVEREGGGACVCETGAGGVMGEGLV